MARHDAFDIDPDIRRARTPPGWIYADPEAFEIQRERVFARAWHWVADDSVVREPGRVHPITLQPAPRPCSSSTGW